MKNIFKIILLIAFSFYIKNNAQQIDTLNYLKQFEVNKANYINQPFSKLLNDISQIQPKTVMAILSFKSNKYTYKSTFYFCEKDYSYNRPITFLIEWASPIQRSQTKYYQDLNHSYFTDDERNFYGSKIIKDIKVYR